MESELGETSADLSISQSRTGRGRRARDLAMHDNLKTSESLTTYSISRCNHRAGSGSVQLKPQPQYNPAPTTADLDD
jgi:hypothetical protein